MISSTPNVLLICSAASLKFPRTMNDYGITKENSNKIFLLNYIQFYLSSQRTSTMADLFI